MIKRFKHKGLEQLFTKGTPAKIQPKHKGKLNDILGMLNAATELRDLNSPGLRLHKLNPKTANRYSLNVDENYRVTFTWLDGDVDSVDYEDTH
ncbi:MAG: peptidase [Gammaproteobacteria bacterium]|nr:MAG: peptidase [Gammaproteobacteria bacterium]TDJ32743.1 MAG: peptidase [Gammaproteobacteria bacterium]